MSKEEKKSSEPTTAPNEETIGTTDLPEVIPRETKRSKQGGFLDLFSRKE